MVSIFRKKETEEYSNKEEEPLLTLRGLEKEEASLMEEKQQLLALREKLQLKAAEKIEIIKYRIQTLKNEIIELRHQCEELESYASLS